jgi:AsmA protein
LCKFDPHRYSLSALSPKWEGRFVSAAAGIKRLGLVIAGIVVAGFAGLLALPLLISADSVRESVKLQIRTVTGLDPVLRGDVAVSLFPTGSVSFNDVSLGDNRTGASALTAQQLVVRLRFFPLLTGRIEIADVTLVRPTITVSFAPDGGSNWSGHIETLARVLQPSPDRVESFSEIRIAGGTAIVRNDAQKIIEVLTDVDFALAWPSISKSFGATGRFVWHDEPIDATLSLSDFVAALVGDRSGLKLRLSGAPLKFAFDGSISHQPTLKMDGMLAADAPSLRDTLRWATYWIAPTGGFGRFALKAQTSVAGANISLSSVNIEIDGNAGEGVLTFAGDGRKTLQGTLAVEGLDLTPYVSTGRVLTERDRNWSRRRIAFDGLTGLDVDLRLSAARVTVATAKLGRTAAAANLRSGNLTVAIGESQAFGGIVKGSVGLASSPGGADLKAQLQFSDVDLDQCLGELLGVRRIEGKGDLGMIVDSSGSSIYELINAVNGSANLTSRKGAIAGVNVEQFLRRLERSPLSGRGDLRGGKTPYDLLAITLKLTQGKAEVEDGRVEGPAVRLGLLGSASIPARDFDLKGTATLLTSTAAEAPAAFELPFLVQGPWDDPLVWPDPQILIKRSGAAAPLLDAVRNRLKRDSRPAPETQRDSRPAPETPISTAPAATSSVTHPASAGE